MSKFRLHRIAAAALAFAAAGAQAQGGPPSYAQGQGGQGMGQQGMQGRQGPPQEAFSACTGKSQGAACSFTAPHGAVSGVCRLPPPDVQGKQLACGPAGMGGGMPGGQGTGQRMGQGMGQGGQGMGQGGQGMGQGGQGMGGPMGRQGPPQEAIAACAGKGQGVACSVATPGGNLSGTCRTVPEGKTACVPAGGPGGQGGGMPPRQ